jgi:regulator of sigma E protease
MIISILAFIVVLGILVVIHEAGHFLAARLVGAPVEVFSVGFGKRLFGFERGGTDYRVSLIPLGGYVRIVGLGPDESELAGHEASEDDLLPRWKRALILIAGPLTNVVFAVVFLAIAFMMGVDVPAYQSQPPVVGWVEPEAPAAEAGVRPGDRIVAVDGRTMETWQDLEASILTSAGHPVRLEVARDGLVRELEMTPESVTRYGIGYSGLLPPLDPVVVQLVPNSPAARAGLEPGDRITAVDDEPIEQFYDLIRVVSPRAETEVTVTVLRNEQQQQFTMTPEGPEGEGKIGISLIFPSELRRLGPVAATGTAYRECRRMTVETFRILGRLFTGKTSLKQVSGPIGIAQISGQAARDGLNSLVWLLGVISLQLGIFNLLPIPVLDGGHLVIIAFETAIRRDLSFKVKERILEVGFVLLILLMVVVIFNDIVRTLPESVYRMIHRG